MIDIWASQNLQIVWFVASVEGVRADHLFEALTGSEPENVQRNKIPSASNPFYGIAGGLVDKVQYQIQVQPGRVDLIVSPSPDSDEDMPVIDTQKEIDSFVARFSKQKYWPTALRLSVVANLLKPASSQSDATKAFFELTGLEVGLDGLTDPLLQLNRRKQIAALPGLHINRLMRYGTATFQQFLLQAGAPDGAHAHAITRERYGTSLTLDFNSVPDGRLFEVENQITICKELAKEVLRVAVNRTLKSLVD